MKNIIAKCSEVNKGSGQSLNLRQKDLDILRNIIHKDKGAEAINEISFQNKSAKRNITLDELIKNRIKNNEKSLEIHHKIKSEGVRKVYLDDIAPKVTLASIGKKDNSLEV